MSKPGAWTRAGHLARLREQGSFDVVVIGGGIVGAGVAKDAAGRGLKVALLERSDFGSGTSSRSTKLLHGGIRYLPQLRFGLVREGLKEQKVLARTADYLYEPLEFVIPIYRGRGFADAPRWARHPRVFPIALRLGLLVYDLLGGRIFGRWRRYRHRTVSAAEALQMAPGLRPEGLLRAFVYWDAQTDDARLTLAAIKTAVANGRAVAVNWLEAKEVHRSGAGYHVVGVDRLGGETIGITTRSVVAATGAFHPPAEDTGGELLRVVQSKGVHLTAAAADVGLGHQAIVLPETEDERVIYVIPWQGTAVIGTTDTPYDGDTAHPTASADDVDYLMRHVREYFNVNNVEPISAWAGLRALVDTGAASTSEASREHKVEQVMPGFVQVAGGKLTGYRHIAADVTAMIAKHLDKKGKPTTAHDPLVGSGGGEGYAALLAKRLAMIDVDGDYGYLLYRRYGTTAAEVVTLLEENESLRHRLGDGSTLAEVVFGARFEAVAGLTDFTLRRTRLSWFTRDHGRADAAAIADALAAELGWDEAARTDHLQRFERELAAEGL